MAIFTAGASDGITITEERAEIVAFSDGYINIDQRILVAIDNTEITDRASLEASDCQVATQGGTTNADTAEDIVGADRLTLVDEFAYRGEGWGLCLDETRSERRLARIHAVRERIVVLRCRP